MANIPVKLAYLDSEFKVADRNKEFFSSFERTDRACDLIESLVKPERQAELAEFIRTSVDPEEFKIFRFNQVDGTNPFHIIHVEDTILYEKQYRLVRLFEISTVMKFFREMNFNLDVLTRTLSMTNECMFIYERSTNMFKLFHYIQDRCDYLYSQDIDEWKKYVISENLLAAGQVTNFNLKMNELKHCPEKFDARIECGLRSGASVMETLVFTGVRYIENDEEFVIGRVMPEGRLQELKQSSALVEELQIDPLTHVYNKKTISSFAQKRFRDGTKENAAFVIVDLDHFKPVNDAYGHLAGDRILEKTGKLLKEIIGDNGLVGRYGGDEFVLILEGMDSENILRGILRSVVVNIKSALENEFTDIKVTASIGAAVYPANGRTLDELFKKADFCLYRAKDKGRDRYVFFRDDLHGELYKKAIEAKSDGIKYDAREILELKIMSEFMQNLGSTPYVAIKDVLGHMCQTFNIDTITIYYGEELNRIYHSGRNFSKLEEASYVHSPAFKAALGERTYLRVDFVSDLRAETQALGDILTERGIKSTIQCVLGTPDNIKGFVSFDRVREPALWAEYEVNCAVMFAAAFNLLPEQVKIDFALYNKLKYVGAK
ncbi:MAG: GGDEF domain-containing protein [Treponema sp.]|nr:GGDEF domain-containing protein [Candidatus Treponema equifaecale]